DIEVAEARLRRTVAQLEVEHAELHRRELLAAYTHIEAPFDGLITARHVDPGSFVEPAGGENATALFELVNTNWLRLVMFLPLADAVSLKKGDSVTLVSLQGLDDPSVLGASLSISRTSRAFQKGSRMMRAETDFNNEDRLLQPGDYGVAEIVLEVFEDLPVIPATALVARMAADGAVEGYYVMRVDDNHQVWRSDVEVLFKDNSVAVIGRGLDTGDRVIAENQDQFSDQQRLQPNQIDSSY
ncbi:MAG TPA: efflux RND transporter periplasmic adaptor subunit, partial [Candidatus Latescibacteria bacterium]|nr:efflux RND transporter periplasmic adaptor subunit [Candidatus Latescibacterota bacterium]